MTIHIGAKKGDIAETVLLPGDPLRAKYIAENFLKDAICYNEIRGMYGFTGTFEGKRVSVQGTGMGVPSISIYTHELINSYNVKNLIRVGSCGSFHKHVELRDIILAMASSGDSAFNKSTFHEMTYCPTASFDLLKKAYDNGVKQGFKLHVGNVLTTDTFYDEAELWKLWAKYGCLAAEMELTGLYTLAAKFNVKALGILTVSDHLVNDKNLTAEERQLTFDSMIKLALTLI